MGFCYRLYRGISWYPWALGTVKSILNGEISHRLVLQPDNGKVLSIVLNGPSLNGSLGYLRRNETDVMMVNNAVETALFSELRPEYICFADPYLFRQSIENYRIYKGIEKVNENIVLFYPGNIRDAVLLRGKRFHIKPVYATNKILNIEDYSVKLFEQNLMSPYFINVGIMAIYVGIQLGYKKINLYGADMSQFKDISVNEDFEIELVNNHFYEDESKRLNLSRIYRRGYDMCYEMKTWYETFSQFKILGNYAKHEGVKIMNMSGSSMLDCFERFKGE